MDYAATNAYSFIMGSVKGGRIKMKNELVNNILLMIKKEMQDIDISKIEMILNFCLNDYEITKKSYEVAVYNVTEKNEQAMRKFLMNKVVAGCSDKTIIAYKGVIGRALSDIGKPFDEIASDDIKYYIAYKRLHNMINDKSAQNIRRYLMSFFKWCESEEMITKNPMSKVPLIREEKKRKEAFTEIEIEKLRDVCENARDKALIEMLLSTGCRVAELSSIKKSDFVKNDCIIVHGKGKKDRKVFVNAKAQLALKKYLEERNDNNEYLFISLRGAKKISPSGIEIAMRELGKKAGVQKVHPHRFRRTCATMALRRGMPLEQVSKMLGHENFETTKIYLDLSEEELEFAHKKYVV